jgi:hypothetical protein
MNFKRNWMPISARNSRFFDEGMEKLEKWADDRKSGLEFELKEIDREIKAFKTESRKILKLEDKLKAQRKIKSWRKSATQRDATCLRPRNYSQSNGK